MDWRSFVSTAAVVFVAELGDKTQLAVITQTCKFGSPWPVFLGSSLALTIVTAIGVLGGQLLGAIIPQNVIHTVAAAAFVVMGLLVWREARQEGEDACPTTCEASDNSPAWNWKAFGATFSLLFLAELGDKTQLAVLGLSSRRLTPWLVFLGGSLALTAVTSLGVIGGQQLCRWIPQRLLLKISAGVFVVMGLLMFTGPI